MGSAGSSGGRSLKARLEGGDRPVGMLVRMPAEALIDLAGAGGFDFVLIDGEHGPNDQMALRHHVALATTHGLAVLVRVGRRSTDDVLRALEIGAEGVVVPYVETVAQAEEAVLAAHFPPLGERGFAQYGQAGGFGAVAPAEQLSSARENTLVVVMVETQLGVDTATEILAVPGVDAVMAGPADLSVSLGLTQGVDEPRVSEAVRHVNEEAARLGRHVLSVVGGPAAAHDAPAGLIVYNITKVLTQTFASLVEGARHARPSEC